MGQGQSFLVDEATPSQTLKDRSVESIATYIKNGHAKDIVVMVSISLLSQRPLASLHAYAGLIM